MLNIFPFITTAGHHFSITFVFSQFFNCFSRGGLFTFLPGCIDKFNLAFEILIKANKLRVTINEKLLSAKRMCVESTLVWWRLENEGSDVQHADKLWFDRRLSINSVS